MLKLFASEDYLLSFYFDNHSHSVPISDAMFRKLLQTLQITGYETCRYQDTSYAASTK